MSRRFKKGDELVVGRLYGYGQSDNQFKVLALYGDVYAWIEWQGEGFDNEIETLYLEPKVKRDILILK